MAGIKGNRRTLYTKKVIKESLIELLKTKEIHQVTVTDICKKADINRGTFYTHYKDAFDLFQSMEDELFDQILKYIKEIPVEEYNSLLLLKVLELIKENKDLCKVLFCNQRDSSILNRILNIANQIDVDQLFNNPNLINKTIANYYMRYSVGGCISIIETWLENDLPESPREIVQIINGINQVNNQSF
ncbi:TetR family transcriptional regulator [Clostridium perfringens]|nr:TetR family transcriptional regulator [Clostridium perfringens]